MGRIFAKLRNSRIAKAVRKWIPNQALNFLYHLPIAILANLYYGFPSKHLKIIAVTGTKGKTSTAHLIYHILTSNRKPAVLISTLGAFWQGGSLDTGAQVTNPGPFVLQGLLRRAADRNLEFAILEVTSHGLDQYRNWGIMFSVSLFTHVSKDHTDYHSGFLGYLQAKAKLIPVSKRVIINKDDPSFEFLKSQAQKHGVEAVYYQSQAKDFESQNQKAAMIAAKELGISENKSKKYLKDFKGVAGRMQVLQTQPFKVVVDFAHTPESLEAALKKLAAEKDKQSKLIAVFGCAGERDKSRRRMGEIAALLADYFIITSEDPRSEDPLKISREIAQYALKQGARRVEIEKYRESETELPAFSIILDRKSAIEAAFGLARPGDVVGLFGKGHEKTMDFGDSKLPWSEHQVAARALRERKQ